MIFNIYSTHTANEHIIQIHNFYDTSSCLIPLQLNSTTPTHNYQRLKKDKLTYAPIPWTSPPRGIEVWGTPVLCSKTTFILTDNLKNQNLSVQKRSHNRIPKLRVQIPTKHGRIRFNIKRNNQIYAQTYPKSSNHKDSWSFQAPLGANSKEF